MSALMLLFAFVSLNSWSEVAALDSDNTTYRGSEQFCGEMLTYTMDFWLFSHAASGELSFSKHPRGYRAYFQAQTQGLIKLFAGSRIECMESIMEYDNEKKRFRPLAFQEIFSHGDREVKKLLSCDYIRLTYTLTLERNKRTVSSRTRKLPAGACDDLLTFFYNFRSGVYGEAQAGNKLKIPILVKSNRSYITVDFSDNATRKKPSFAHYAVLSMDRDVTHARSKRVNTWLSHDLIPQCSVIVDAYFFGDLVTTLEKRSFNHE